MEGESQELPGYRLGELLHGSSTSAVYRATRLADGAAVVVKCSQRGAAAVRQQTLVRNEYELLRGLKSDLVIKAHDLFWQHDQLVLVLENFAGVSVKRWLTDAQASLGEKLELALELALALSDVHAAKVIHKDINSHNVLYDPDTRRVKLIDFGIATRFFGETSKFRGALEGTLDYIAPEQTGRMSRGVDYRADLYSLGATLYELFSGSLPHEAGDPVEIVHFHIAGTPEPLRQRVPDIPEALSSIVMKLLQKAPEQRYQSAAGLAADLETCLARLDAGLEPFELGTRDIVDRFELPQRLYGREAATETLRSVFRRVASGSVEAVLVAGQGGVGKTSLVQEMHRTIAEKHGYFVAGKFDPLQRDVPFTALVSALQDLVEQLLTESEDRIVAWRDAIQAAVGANGQIVIDVVPALELIIGPQPATPELDPFEAQNRFNLVFQSFIQVFGERAHPLVLFLDDMQWADQASLNLVTLILSAPDTESLMLVQSYRDTEVSAMHPFMLAVKQQRQHANVVSVELKSLEPRDVTELVADTLHIDAASARPLAEIVHTKTHGNPFFIRQFLETLHAEGLIVFEPADNTFGFDSSAVQSVAITENVAELMAAKLGKLPASTQHALRLGAAIGRQFELESLAQIAEQTPAELAACLQPALQAGLVVPSSSLASLDRDSPLVYRCFEFLHDRVQHAAYEALPEADRAGLHLAIGRALSADCDEQSADARLFDVVNHMNQGAALITSASERRELAELNLRAGAKARKSTAYGLAEQCYRKVIDLLGEDAWAEDYASVYESYSRLAESQLLTADYAGAFETIDTAEVRASCAIDRAQLLTIKIHVYLGSGKMPEALACGRQALSLYGIDLPDSSDAIAQMLKTEIAAILEATGAIGVENLLDLQVMEDSKVQALIETLTHCLPAAFQTDQQQYALLCCKMVTLSLEYGNCPLSARAYSSFGALLASAFGNFPDAYRFAKLGVDLAERLGDPAVFSSVHCIWALFASPWVKPIEESIELFRKGVQYGLQTGDHQHVGYSAARMISHQQFKGMPLDDLREETLHTLALLDRIGDATNMEYLPPRLRLMDWLRGERPHGDTLASDAQDEAELTRAIRARGNRSFESDWLIVLTMHRYLCGDFEAAHAFAKQSETLVPFSAAFIPRAEHNFYYSLTLTALDAAATPEQRKQHAARLNQNQMQLKGWADACPENFAPMYLLVEAERARIRGARVEAMDLYDEALRAARKHDFVNIEALAAERASQFWLDSGKPDIADMYLERALSAYDRWGATGKSTDLRRRHCGEGAMTVPATARSTTRGTDHVDALDLATVLKASQAIASEIVLERLLESLIDIILENAGAESAALVLRRDDEYLVEGSRARGMERAKVLMSEPLRGSSVVPSGIVNYAIRTGEHLVLDDPADRGRFRNDPYIRDRRPRSVLCAPVLHKNELTGVIYLENNQVSGAFTPGRLEALNILLAQIAVSIENATLYQQQEQHRRAIEDANVALTNEVGERKRAEQELGRYKDHLEELVAKRTEELASAQGRLVELSRRAGMAEVASGVLHNVGNVMNSVNVGTSVARDAVNNLRGEGVGGVCDLLESHAGDLAEFVTADPAGRKIPVYLRKLGDELSDDKGAILAKIDNVLEHLEHMKKIVAAQQSYARVNGVNEPCLLEDIAETALSITQVSLLDIEVERHYEPLPPALMDRHQILQILVNLISNAKHAVRDQAPQRPKIDLAIARDDGGVRIEVRDNGVGIPAENMSSIFNHGFTTKRDGHGFGLHNCANAAHQLGGRLTAESAGTGAGARLTLWLPFEPAVHAGQEDCA